MHCLRVSLIKLRGFSIVELLVASLILSVIIAGLFLTLNIGQVSNSLSTANLELQSEIKLAMDWIVKDLRQTISWNIASVDNNPTPVHLKFNLWVWNTTTNTWELSAAYIEYNYDINTQRLTRLLSDESGNITTLVFNNISQAPFYTTYISSGDPGNSLNADLLRNDRKLIIVLNGRKLTRASLPLTFNLQAEVRIRNG